MHLRFNFDACPMHSPSGFVHLTHQNLSARALFCLNSLAKVNTQLLIYNCGKYWSIIDQNGAFSHAPFFFFFFFRHAVVEISNSQEAMKSTNSMMSSMESKDMFRRSWCCSSLSRLIWRVRSMGVFNSKQCHCIVWIQAYLVFLNSDVFKLIGERFRV